VAKAVEEVRNEVQEVRREVQRKGGAPTAPAATTARARSWATVAAGEAELPAKRIPGRLNREILVRGSAVPALTRRSPQEIVQAVNGVSEKKGAIAARKLPSGDVIVTFQDTEMKNWHSANGRWIGTAFGESAKEAKRTFAVLMKGMLKRELKDITEADFGKELGLASVDKVRFRIPTMAGVTRATVLVTMTSQEEARKACEDGVVWRAQILDCEPYWAALQATQCYRCWEWGHTQRFCKKSSLCPRCGTAAHGEAQCPTHTNEIPLRCSNCTGRHPAWARWCPDAVKARGAAREAYHFRPRTFELAQRQQQQQEEQQQLPRMRNVAFRGNPPSEEEEFQEVTRKRPRGRPPAFAVAQEQAARSLTQGKLTFAVRDRTVQAAATEVTAPGATAAGPLASAGDLDVGMQGV
jgi:hypothetical protein